MDSGGTKRRLTRRDLLAILGGAGVAMTSGCGSGGNGGDDAAVAGSLPERLPPQSETPHYESLLSLAARIEARQVSPVAITRHLLERIERLEPSLHAYATVMAATALESAKRAEAEIAAGSYRGPLHGVPVAVKDLCYTKGVPTMGGMAIYRDFVPDFDATVVKRLDQAGAILLGKLNLTEGAMVGYHPDFEVPRSPWDPDLWPGASSSGSGVATAAGLCFGSLGTDTGGSIRYPSQTAGIVGLKPTYGRVSRHGVLPLAPSMDHVGPMTRRVADAAAMLQVIGGPDPNDPTTLDVPVPDLFTTLDAGVKGLRIGYDATFSTEGVDPRLVTAIENALGQLAASPCRRAVRRSAMPGSCWRLPRRWKPTPVTIRSGQTTSGPSSGISWPPANHSRTSRSAPRRDCGRTTAPGWSSSWLPSMRSPCPPAMSQSRFLRRPSAAMRVTSNPCSPTPSSISPYRPTSPGRRR